MNTHHTRLLRFYGRVLSLYPSRFREAFAEEMLSVFQLQIQAYADLDLWRALQIAWSELRPLPFLLAAAHLRERKHMNTKTGLERWFVQPQGSWKESLLAVLPFLLMGVLPGIIFLTPSLRALPITIGAPILIGLASILVVLGMIGLFVRLPRWSLVYAGILLTFLSLGTVFVLTEFGKSLPVPVHWPSLWASAILFSVHLILLFLLVAVLLWGGDRFRLTQPFSRELRADPSLISFMLYGGAFLLVLGSYEDVSGVDYYLILSSLAMACGAWAYLRMDKTAPRLAALTVATTVAAAFSLVANLTLVDYNSPPVGFWTVSLPMTSLFIGLFWLVALAMIGLPLAIFRSRGERMAGQGG
jgi:hypothetical protein